MANTPYKKGTRVEWDWRDGTASGKIIEVHTESIKRTINGTQVRRNGASDDPAYVIELDNKGQAMKSHSEVRKA